MPKIICMISLVIFAVLALIFLCDLALPKDFSPFYKASILMDIVGIITVLVLGYMSFTTLKQL